MHVYLNKYTNCHYSKKEKKNPPQTKLYKPGKFTLKRNSHSLMKTEGLKDQSALISHFRNADGREPNSEGEKYSLV